MKNFTLIFMATMFTILGVELLQAKTYGYIKSDCAKHGYAWRNGKCRDKIAKKSKGKAIIEPTNQDVYNNQYFDPLFNDTNNSQPIMGGNSRTFAPQIFMPVAPFNNPGLIGNYFSGNGIATIHDPSGQTDESYSFDGVKSMSGNMRPVGLTQIGSFKDPNFIPSGVYCSGCPTETKILYGNLVPTGSAA